jgi:hypothetical protein
MDNEKASCLFSFANGGYLADDRFKMVEISTLLNIRA